MHDRRVAIELRQVSKQNLNVNRIPLKETRMQQGNTVYSTSGYDWTELSTVRSCYDALTNFGIINQMLWPYDLTAMTMMKLYNVYSWMAYPSIKESLRVRLLCDHFARVSESNVDLAVQRRQPNNYWEMERILKVLLREGGLPDSPPVTQYNSPPGGGQNHQAAPGRGKGGLQGQNSRGGGAGARQRKPAAVAPNGRLICFNFQKQQGCSNPPAAGGGCVNPATQINYAHVCAWFNTTTRTYCVQGHAKCSHPG
jgi:hypothetical protein